MEGKWGWSEDSRIASTLLCQIRSSSKLPPEDVGGSHIKAHNLGEHHQQTAISFAQGRALRPGAVIASLWGNFI